MTFTKTINLALLGYTAEVQRDLRKSAWLLFSDSAVPKTNMQLAQRYVGLSTAQRCRSRQRNAVGRKRKSVCAMTDRSHCAIEG